MDIKQLKPRKSSRYSQGYINPTSCKKLINRSEPIIYRSSYERKFTIWCETCKDVKLWGSECIRIPYMLPDGSKHSYYPDYYIELVDGTKMVIEIKPSNQTKAPVNENSWAYKEWVKNSCKWQAAKEFCKHKGYQFKILTEQTISRL